MGADEKEWATGKAWRHSLGALALLLLLAVAFLGGRALWRRSGQLSAGAAAELGGGLDARQTAAVKAQSADGLGQRYAAAGRFADALTQHRRAAALWRRAGPGATPSLAASLIQVSADLTSLGQYPEAEAQLNEVLRVQEPTLGPDHPDVARTLNRLCSVLYHQGKAQQAEAAERRALKIRETAYGPDHPLVAETLANLAPVLDRMGRFDEALACYLRALAIQRKVFGPQHLSVANTLGNIGTLYAAQRQWKEAAAYYQQAADIAGHTVGLESPQVTFIVFNLGKAYSVLGQQESALPYLRAALAADEKAHGDSPETAMDLSAVAEAEWNLAHLDRALPLMERSVRIYEGRGMTGSQGAMERFLLAQMLWDSGGDKARALDLARRAREGLEALGKDRHVAENDNLVSVKRWLAERGD
jgi:tetratricopeptide (TPR) repeat protein